MVKNPDLMIERPYTPINDVRADGEVRIVVKRVKGGEVGRWVSSFGNVERRWADGREKDGSFFERGRCYGIERTDTDFESESSGLF
jgi:hypothetical protein